jgi:hypothetical protein
LLKFQQSADRRFFNAGDSACRRGPQSEGYGHGFIVIEKQRGQSRPCTELVTTSYSGGRVHWVTETAQAVDISAERSSCHVKALREFRARPIPLCLEQG